MKLFLKIAFLCCIAAAVLAAVLWPKRSSLLERGLETWINYTQKVLFEGPVDIEGLELSSDLFVTVKKFRGVWRTPESSFPFELLDIRLTDRVTHFLSGKPVNAVFRQFRPAGSKYPGVSGKITLYNDPSGTFELQAEVKGLYLEELTPFNPEILSKSSGKLTGTLLIRAHETGTEKIQLDVNVAEPGGRVPAYFFDTLLPYLPSAEKKVLAQIREQKSVSYKSSHMTLSLAEKDALKILLQIRVPDYNLNLNLNLTLRVEDNAAFFDLAELMGLIKVGIS